MIFIEILYHYIRVYIILKDISAGGCDGRATVQLRGATPRPRSGAEARRTPCPKGGSQEELPHVRGQGQQLRVPDCSGAGTAERSYPVSEVRGGSREEIPSVRGQRWRREELPHVRSQGQWPRVPDCNGAGMAKRRYRASEVRGGDERSYLASELRGGGGQEEIPHAPSPRPRAVAVAGRKI